MGVSTAKGIVDGTRPAAGPVRAQVRFFWFDQEARWMDNVRIVNNPDASLYPAWSWSCQSSCYRLFTLAFAPLADVQRQYPFDTPEGLLLLKASKQWKSQSTLTFSPLANLH
jgi:hypothetical protein